jgi:hypothetical protein
VPCSTPALLTEHIASSDGGTAYEGALIIEGVGSSANSPPMPAREGDTSTTNQARHLERGLHPRCTGKSPDKSKHIHNNIALPITAREGDNNSNNKFNKQASDVPTNVSSAKALTFSCGSLFCAEFEVLRVLCPRDDPSPRDEHAPGAADHQHHDDVHPMWDLKVLRLLLGLRRSSASVQTSTAGRLLLCWATSRIFPFLRSLKIFSMSFSTETISLQSGITKRDTKREASTYYVSREAQESRTT